MLLSAVRKGGCDPIDEWAGLQCLVEGGVCEECVVEGLQRYLLTSGYLLTSADSSRREQAGQLMVKMSDRMVSPYPSPSLLPSLHPFIHHQDRQQSDNDITETDKHDHRTEKHTYMYSVMITVTELARGTCTCSSETSAA